MSAPEPAIEKFLERWSRRKRLAAQDGAEEAQAAPIAPAARLPHATLMEFDPACLPPIESINAASDVRAFLAPGVPVELTRAALRRAWIADPAIRNFVEIAENQWDFDRPDGVPGFGSLDATPELRQLVAELCGDRVEAEHAEVPAQPAQLEAAGDAPAYAVSGPSVDAPVPKEIADAPNQPTVRKHGGALPR
jgi:hypothetical protein